MKKSIFLVIIVFLSFCSGVSYSIEHVEEILSGLSGEFHKQFYTGNNLLNENIVNDVSPDNKDIKDKKFIFGDKGLRVLIETQIDGLAENVNVNWYFVDMYSGYKEIGKYYVEDKYYEMLNTPDVLGSGLNVLRKSEDKKGFIMIGKPINFDDLYEIEDSILLVKDGIPYKNTKVENSMLYGKKGISILKYSDDGKQVMYDVWQISGEDNKKTSKFGIIVGDEEKILLSSLYPDTNFPVLYSKKEKVLKYVAKDPKDDYYLMESVHKLEPQRKFASYKTGSFVYGKNNDDFAFIAETQEGKYMVIKNYNNFSQQYEKISAIGFLGNGELVFVSETKNGNSIIIRDFEWQSREYTGSVVSLASRKNKINIKFEGDYFYKTVDKWMLADNDKEKDNIVEGIISKMNSNNLFSSLSKDDLLLLLGYSGKINTLTDIRKALKSMHTEYLKTTMKKKLNAIISDIRLKQQYIDLEDKNLKVLVEFMKKVKENDNYISELALHKELQNTILQSILNIKASQQKAKEASKVDNVVEGENGIIQNNILLTKVNPPNEELNYTFILLFLLILVLVFIIIYFKCFTKKGVGYRFLSKNLKQNSQKLIAMLILTVKK